MLDGREKLDKITPLDSNSTNSKPNNNADDDDDDDADNDGGDNNDNDNNDDERLPWDRAEYWADILRVFPNVQDFTLLVEGRLDMTDRWSENFQQSIARIRHSTHAVCSQMQTFHVCCSQPDRFGLGGKLVSARLIFVLQGNGWHLQSHEVYIGRWVDIQVAQGRRRR